MHPAPLLLLLLTILGNTALLTITLNLIFRRMTSDLIWTLWVILHGVAVVALPLCLFWLIYARGPALLYTSNWNTMPWWVIAYTAMTFAALAYVIFFIARARRAAKPSVLRDTRVETVDIAKDLGHPPSGRGLRGWMARWPGNGVFKLELSEKHLVLPGLPSEWDGLRILHVTDVHLKGSPDRSFF